MMWSLGLGVLQQAGMPWPQPRNDLKKANLGETPEDRATNLSLV